MARNKVKKEKPPVRLLGTMFLLVLGLVAVYVGMALGIFTLVQRLVHLEDASYTLLWPILILSVSAILGVLLAIFIFRGYLAPLSRLMQATQSVAEGDYTVRVDMRGARGEVAEYIRSFNKMAEELSSVALLRMDFVNTFSHEFKTPLISIRGFAKLLQNDDLTSEQRRTYTDTVVQQSERLAAMSTHVLELARYENTEIVSDKTLYSLDEQLRRCVRQQEREWLKKSLTVEGDLDPVDYYGNEELVEHIWSNLLSNRWPGGSSYPCAHRTALPSVPDGILTGRPLPYKPGSLPAPSRWSHGSPLSGPADPQRSRHWIPDGSWRHQ